MIKLNILLPSTLSQAARVAKRFQATLAGQGCYEKFPFLSIRFVQNSKIAIFEDIKKKRKTEKIALRLD